MGCENTEYEYDEVGTRTLTKGRCKAMDWENVKVISPYEIAYCIYTHDNHTYCIHTRKLCIDDVPEKRKKSVQKEIDKLVKKNDKEANKEAIKSVLAVYESDAIIHEFLENGTKIDKLPPDTPDTVTGYILDPDLFANVESAKDAVTMAKNLDLSITRSIMQNGVRFKDRKYDKDIKSAQKATIKLFKAYEKIGISRLVTAKALKSIEMETDGTMNQEIDSWRKVMSDYFHSLGNSKTNAKKIAIAITLYVKKIY